MAEIHKPEVIGVNVIQAMQTAKAPVAPTTTYPLGKDALPAWLEAQEGKGDPLKPALASARLQAAPPASLRN
jgi:hypothetical protein